MALSLQEALETSHENKQEKESKKEWKRVRPLFAVRSALDDGP